MIKQTTTRQTSPRVPKPARRLAEITCVLAPHRDALLEVCDITLLNRCKPLQPVLIYLRCDLPCGATRNYLSRNDVPHDDDPCDCGKLSRPHYFVRYSPGASSVMVSA